MENIDLIATAPFGLETVVRWELEDLGYENIRVENGKVNFKGSLEDIAITNLWLRVADRVLVKIGEFKALEFEELYDKTYELPWDEWLPEDANFIVEGRSVNSKLFSISDSQSIVEKAIVDKLKTKYTDVDWFPKSGARYTIEVSLLRDVATLTIDTSGDGLHKRGYRERPGDAPIKETLAAAMIKLSYWNKDRPLLDPFCGSGTIPIEAAMIGRNIAPGLDRKFDAEYWDIMEKDYFQKARQDAFSKIDHDVELNILASDIDKYAIEKSKDNAANLGLEEDIKFIRKDMKDLHVDNNYGVLITNPPYGERLGEDREIEKLYKDFGNNFNHLDTWSIYVLTSNKNFEKFYGKRANRKRKLFNGRLEVDYYQFYGPRPPRKD